MHIAFLDGFVLFSNSLLIVCLLSNTIVIERMWGIFRSVFLLAVFCFVLFVPIFKGCTLAQIMRGVFGDLSITSSLVLMFWIVAKLFSVPIVNPLNKGVALVIFVLGCFLYASSLGFIGFDIYSYGYLVNSPMLVLLIYFVVQLILWQINKIFAFIWLVTIICFVFKCQDSINLWDYLFDSVLWLVSFCTITRRQKKISSSDIIFDYRV